jgi:hypothetical protein
VTLITDDVQSDTIAAPEDAIVVDPRQELEGIVAGLRRPLSGGAAGPRRERPA